MQRHGDGGKYLRFGARVLGLRALNWYDVDRLGETINRVRRINFSVVAARDEALDQLNSLIGDAPFNRTVRFNEQKAYVCEGLGDWAKKFTILREALAYKDDTKDSKKQQLTSDKSHQQNEKSLDIPKLLDMNDALHAFYMATKNMLTEIAQCDRVYDQAIFEDEFSLVWEDGTK